MFNVGDYVTRKTYNNDIVFKIIDIKNDVYYLK
ncbi:MAG: sporulation peptidase YabG [bacterium]|nr:sporulation peptidase YabG [bacterium]